MRNNSLHRPRSAAFVAAFATALALSSAAPDALADEILQKGAKNPFKGTVLSEDLAKVKYKLDGVAQAQEIDSALVAEIFYDDAPEAFTKGRELLKKGDAENAVNSFRLALKSKTKNNWIAVHGNYQLGVALQMWGAKDASKLKEAATVFAQLLKDAPECRFMPDALRRGADALAAAKDAAGAAALYDRLAEVAQQKKLGILWEAEARIRKADAYVTAGMTKEAEAAYAAAGSFADSNAATQKDDATKRALLAITGRSQLSQGAALLRNKKFGEARQFFEKVAMSATAQSEVVAAALNGVGEVLLEEGKPRDALEQFARVRVQYYLAREETARATYFLGKSCLALKDAEPNGKKKAADYFAEVVERYGDTPWADRARAEIK
ncbi:MAG: tetratricopeptide repeat protein [Planctomycetes bacterium]|nr:tetratricopeptide repeat protein [Planctomycetota bacterium]